MIINTQFLYFQITNSKNLIVTSKYPINYFGLPVKFQTMYQKLELKRFVSDITNTTL